MIRRISERRSRNAIALAAAFAFSFAACTSATSTPTSTSPTPTKPPPKLTGLHVDQPKWKTDPKTWAITLRWDDPAPPFVVDHYEVTRNGAPLPVTGTASTFDDTTVLPGVRYRYSVATVDASGAQTPAATDSVRTGTPPTGEGRLSGRYFTRTHVTSSNVGGSDLSFYWIFAPTCKSGPCSAKLTVEGHGLLGTLTRAASGYHGTFRVPFFIVDCFGNRIDETIDVSIHVTGARVDKGQWHATGFAGTFNESAGGPFPYLSGYSHFAVIGKAEA
jgi:hypothetical protein